MNYIKFFDENRIEEYKARANDFQVLERVPITRKEIYENVPFFFERPQENERLGTIIFMDTETTGLDLQKDVLIEIGLVKATYSLDRKIILSIDKYYDELEDPGFEMPEETIKIHGIRNEAVKGRRIDDNIINSFCTDNTLMVSHNAKFDRKIFEKRFPHLGNLPWACSLEDINWKGLGYNGAKLIYLNFENGYFYDAHRAFVDTLAMIWVLHVDQSAFAMLLDNAFVSSYMIEANVPFGIKDEVKNKGFKFNSKNKTWCIKANNPDDLKKKQNFLLSLSNEIQCNVIEENARTRFK